MFLISKENDKTILSNILTEEVLLELTSDIIPHLGIGLEHHLILYKQEGKLFEVALQPFVLEGKRYFKYVVSDKSIHFNKRILFRKPIQKPVRVHLASRPDIKEIYIYDVNAQYVSFSDPRLKDNLGETIIIFLDNTLLAGTIDGERLITVLNDKRQVLDYLHTEKVEYGKTRKLLSIQANAHTHKSDLIAVLRLLANQYDGLEVYMPNVQAVHNQQFLVDWLLDNDKVVAIHGPELDSPFMAELLEYYMQIATEYGQDLQVTLHPVASMLDTNKLITKYVEQVKGSLVTLNVKNLSTIHEGTKSLGIKEVTSLLNNHKTSHVGLCYDLSYDLIETGQLNITEVKDYDKLNALRLHDFTASEDNQGLSYNNPYFNALHTMYKNGIDCNIVLEIQYEYSTLEDLFAKFIGYTSQLNILRGWDDITN